MEKLNSKKIRIAVLIASFNRCNSTLRCLNDLQKSKESNHLLDIFLVDSNSSDNTVKEVKALFPYVRIKLVSTDTYWNRAMLYAWHFSLLEKVKYHFFLWLNNDTFLNKNGLKSIMEDYCRVDLKSIIVGTTDFHGKITYGGRKKLSQRVLAPNGKPQKVKYINGNCVLIPKSAVEIIGVLDEKYSHSLGDLDYGLRAIESGFSLYSSSKIIGICENNNTTWYRNKRIKQRWKILNSPKGVPLNEYFYFNHRHFGILNALKFIIATFIALLVPSFYQLIKSK